MYNWKSLVVVLAATVFFSGCVYEHPGVRTGSAQEKELRFAESASALAENRYLLLPITLPAGDKYYAPKGFSTQKYFLGHYAWSGLFFSKHHSHEWTVNLVVADLEQKQQYHLFEESVAIGDWRFSFEHKGETPQLRYPGKLLLVARTEDTNGDGVLDHKDPARLFVHDLKTRETTPVTPDRTNIRSMTVDGDRVVLLLDSPRHKDALSVFIYRPVAGTGEMVFESITTR